MPPSKLKVTAKFPAGSPVTKATLFVRKKKKMAAGDLAQHLPQDIPGHKHNMRALGGGKFEHTIDPIPNVGADHRLIIRVVGTDDAGNSKAVSDAPGKKHP